MENNAVDFIVSTPQTSCTPIRSEKYQFNWKPRYNSKSDLELVKQLIQVQEQHELKKTELVRKALTDFVHTNADFTICMQCGQEQTTSEQWRSEIR